VLDCIKVKRLQGKQRVQRNVLLGYKTPVLLAEPVSSGLLSENDETGLLALAPTRTNPDKWRRTEKSGPILLPCHAMPSSGIWFQMWPAPKNASHGTARPDFEPQCHDRRIHARV